MTSVETVFDLPKDWWSQARIKAQYVFDDHAYRLTRLGRNVIYFVDGDADGVLNGEAATRRTLFVSCDCPPAYWPAPFNNGLSNCVVGCQGSRWEGWQSDICSQQEFMALVCGGESGRLALYISPSHRVCSVFMLFRPDGTGTCLHGPQTLTSDPPQAQYRSSFQWNLQWDGPSRGIVDAPWERVVALCEDVLREQVLPCMADPYVTYEELPDQPATFVCGSEQELEHLTRCILHIHPRLFNVSSKGGGWRRLHRVAGKAEVTYSAATSRYPGGMASPPQTDDLKRLFELAYRFNTFSGGQWMFDSRCVNRRRECFWLRPATLPFTIAPPSLHEQAEALLFLSDWLEGKVSDEERRYLLRLNTRAERAAFRQENKG